MPEKPVEIYEEDFIKTIMDYEMFKRGISVRAFGESIMNRVLYSASVKQKGNAVMISMEVSE